MPAVDRFLRIGLVACFLITVFGCSADYGRLSRSRDVDDAFVRSEVRPGYRYYQFGGQNAPLAIVGIDAAYTLTTRVWTPIPDITPALLKQRVAAMTDQLGFSPANFGGILTTPDGTPFGIWYSPYASVMIKFGEDNTVAVSPPRRPEDGRDRSRRRLLD
jgi:hypothetical protein